MSPTETFFAAVSNGDAEAARCAIGDGADINAISERGESAIVEVHTAMLRHPRKSRVEWWKVLESIVQAGAIPDETETHLIAPLQFPVTLWEPDIQSIAANLESISDYCGRDYLAGTLFFVKCQPPVSSELSETKLKREKEAQTATYRNAVSQLYKSALDSACIIVAGPNLEWRDQRRPMLQCLHLFPTDDKYAVVALFGLADWKVDWEGPELPARTISKLKEIDSQWPFRLRGCGPMDLELEFLKDLRDAEGVIRELKSLFPLDYWYSDEEIEASAQRYNGQRILRIRIGIG